MAWLFEKTRKCPSCGYTEKILVIKVRGGYKLSCGWCAKLSKTMPTVDTFFKAWGAPSSHIGDEIVLKSVLHNFKSLVKKEPPISVRLGVNTALVLEKLS